MTLLIVAFAVVPLLDDRPPLDDLNRFPPLCVAEEQLRLNRYYREHLEYRSMIEHHQFWALHAALVDADRLYAAWNMLRWACLYGDPANRRDMLRQLRDVLGPDAYYAGRMPPPFPLHYLVKNP